MDAIEKRARELLASCLDEWGHPCEAENVREGEDLESYESELRLISQLLYFGMDTAEGHGRSTRTPTDGHVLVPVEPTVEMLCEIQLVAHFTGDALRARYAAMLAARPEVPGA